MAAQSPCGWSWNSPTHATATVKCSSNSSGLSSFHSAPQKRPRFTASSSPSSSSSKSTAKQGLRKPLKLDSASPNPSKLVKSSNGNRSEDENRITTLSFKSFFGKRSLWRRIFFASKKVRSIILLNVITVVYASNFSVVKEVEAIMDPAAFTVVRFAVSAIPFIPFVFRARGDIHTRNAGMELGFWVSLGYLMQALGLLTSDAGRASFISMFTVVIVPLLDGWRFVELLSAVFFGVHMLRTEHISRNTKRENFLPLLGYEVCVVAIMSTMWYCIGSGSGGLQDCNPSLWTWKIFWEWMLVFPWIPALYSGIFSTGLCLWVEMAAMRDVSATETAIIYGLEPVWGAGFAWFLLGERWGTTGWIGAALVLGGSLTVQIFGSTSPAKSYKEEKDNKKLDYPVISDKHNRLSASPVTVSSRKDIPDMLNK
ncbi:uncharacterized protein Pyn_25810 [Prunus yedoensis var. nudiflora]|uniref:EamA domain-containing protein n=1 Tax=Prunus yedoensis var. nudiflora TaxID=2094558 RepID=A0A314XG83_PRUYE|nr:uncharacterized protein Pyn_25810 [Prunus yedoensis var. nudiflora]